MMRTTVDLDDSVLAAARAIAQARGVSLSRAISDLARRGLAPVDRVRRRDGFPVFDVAGADPITAATVAELLSEDG